MKQKADEAASSPIRQLKKELCTCCGFRLNNYLVEDTSCCLWTAYHCTGMRSKQKKNQTIIQQSKRHLHLLSARRYAESREWMIQILKMSLRGRIEHGLAVHLWRTTVARLYTSATFKAYYCIRMKTYLEPSVTDSNWDTTWQGYPASRVEWFPPPSINSACTCIWNGAVGWSGIPTSLTPSSHLNQWGSEPGGELNFGCSASDAAWGSHILGSHSYGWFTTLWYPLDRSTSCSVKNILTHNYWAAQWFSAGKAWIPSHHPAVFWHQHSRCDCLSILPSCRQD